jgi:hypothetical protein
MCAAKTPILKTPGATASEEKTGQAVSPSSGLKPISSAPDGRNAQPEGGEVGDTAAGEQRPAWPQDDAFERFWGFVQLALRESGAVSRFPAYATAEWAEKILNDELMKGR